MADDSNSGRFTRQELEARLEEAEATLGAIRRGEVDALVVEGPGGPQTFTLQTADQNYRLLVEEMAEGAAILAPDGGVLFANESLARLLEIPGERLIASSLRDHVVQASLGAFDRVVAAAEGRAECQLNAPDGPIPVAISVRPLRLDEVEGCCVIVSDLTEPRRLAQSERERAMAEAASRAKDRFLSILGHELRNPLGAIRNALEILKDPPDPATDRHMRRIVERQVTHVSALVDDLLDISRIESGKLEVQPRAHELGAIVESVVEGRRLEAADEGIVLTLAGDGSPVHAMTDATRLRQVLDNLLSNAIRAIGSDGRIEIRVERKGADGLVRVRDDGRGIPKSDLARIFEPFVQGRGYDETARRGLGLGLTLARRLVQMQAGELTATSDGEGRGAEFVVRLPAGEAPEERRRRRRREPPATMPLRVMIVDDDRDCADSLRVLLDRDGHAVRVAYSGPAALEMAKRSELDVVISDIGLPGMDGYALARELAHRLGDTKLVALSGYVEDRALRLAREAGFSAHLGKPVDLARLRRLLERIGSERLAGDALEEE